MNDLPPLEKFIENCKKTMISGIHLYQRHETKPIHFAFRHTALPPRGYVIRDSYICIYQLGEPGGGGKFKKERDVRGYEYFRKATKDELDQIFLQLYENARRFPLNRAAAWCKL